MSTNTDELAIELRFPREVAQAENFKDVAVKAFTDALNNALDTDE
ncbi:hypothetical protein ABQE62_29985 [Mycolicibacterium fortuitum]